MLVCFTRCEILYSLKQISLGLIKKLESFIIFYFLLVQGAIVIYQAYDEISVNLLFVYLSSSSDINDKVTIEEISIYLTIEHKQKII